MRLDQVNLKDARIWVKRAKGSDGSAQSLRGDELWAVKRYLVTREAWLLVSERGQQMVRQAVNHVVREAANRGWIAGALVSGLADSVGLNERAKLGGMA